MTKRGYIRMLSFSLVLVAVLGSYALINMNRANSYKALLELSYQQSLNELSESLDSIETSLTKGVYSSSDKMLLEISSDLYSECANAKEALSRLPATQMNLGSTYKFITQASDYSKYIANKVADNKEISEKEHKNLTTLLNYAKRLNSSVEAMVSVCNNGGKITARNVKGSNIEIGNMTADFSVAEETFKDYPTLLYDGPFADAVLNREPLMIKESKEITEKKAREIAARTLSCNMSELSTENTEGGKIPCYVFSFGQRTVGITRQGGYVLYVLYGGKISRANINEEKAIGLAEKHLQSLGYNNMISTYSMTNDNVCVINFAYHKDNVSYYSDLIKVGISLDDGKLLSLEAEGYLTNHRKRDTAKAKISKSKAQDNINPYLEVISSKSCVIPKDNGTEVQCYEFRCKSSETGEEVLIYINTQTGKEEDIMLLLYTDGGTLTK